ncbi:MAG: hypothetical protein JW850_21865, partial [Thermoflexales bacterium]|nr:hypothetical protein [Thermoflexales bacterium]
PLNTGYSGLEYGYPLSRTFNAVELVGNPATLQHLVQTDVRTGFVFYTVQHVYTPYLVVDSHAQAIEGNSFQDLVSNFPFGTMLVTAEWLMVDLRDASGKVETHVREIFDSVGFERRQAGGTLAVEQAGEPVPVVSQESYYTVLVSPSRVPASVMDAHYQKMALAAAQGQAAFATLEALGDEITNEDLPELRQARHAYGEVARVSQRLHLLLFASMSDYGADWLQDSFLVKPYAASPRLFIVSWERDQANDTDQMRFDLRKDAVRTVLYPGQTWQGLVAFNYARGVLEASLESALMEQLTGEQAISVASVFREASQQGIRLEKVSAMNLGVLDRLEISDEAKARITEALEKHQCFVLVPERSVTVGGQDTVGWFLIDIINGHTLDVMENGQHQAIVEYDLLFQGSHQEYLMALIGFFHGFAAYGIAFLAKLMAKMPFNDIDRKQAYGEAFQEASDVIDQIGQAMTDAWSTFEDCSFVDNDVVGSMAGATDAYVNGVGFSASFSVKISVTLFETPGFVDCLNSLGADLPTGTVEQSFVEVEFEFKMGGLINGAALAQAKIASWLDPPLPKSLMAYATPSRRAPAYAQGTLWAAQSLQGNEIYAALTSNASQARGTLAARWVAGSQAALEFTQLAAPIAALYAPDGTALGSGAVQVDPLQSRATATLAELPITYVLTGEGSNSFYAPALPQLGAGSNWLNGLLRLNSSQSYTVTVYRALATLDGSRVCTGTFSMVVPGAAAAVSVQVAGHTAAPNLAAQARIQAQPADLTLGPAAGIVTLDGVALDASNGLALAGYTGPMTVTPSTPAADLVELNGTASLFSLAVSPTLVLAAPHTPASVRASILANLSDNYTLTVEGPLDWSLAVDHAGQITALSPLGAAPGDYAFRLTAQSHAHPALTLSTAYTVRTSAQHGLELGVQPDPTFTVPTGPLAPGADPDSINNGQVQLPGAAYTLDITNTSTTSHTFSISVSSLSLPPDWLIVSGNVGQAGTTLTLPAGGVGRIGLYISPAQLTSLPPAASYPFTVTATMGEAPSLSRQQVAAFAMPAIAFNYLEADPSLVYGSPGVSTTFDLALTNVGNAAGAFDVHVSLPITTWAGGGSYNVTLPAGESDERALVFTPTHAALGSHGNIRITSPAPGTAYTQTAYVAVQIAGPCVLRTQNTIRVAAQLGDTQLAASLQNLTLQLGRWELDESDLTLQARVVAALNDVLAHLHARYPQIDTGDLEALAAAPAVDGFCAPAAALQDDLTTIAQRHVTAAFAPGLAATLLGRPVSYTLTLRNHGTLTTTYAVTLNGLPAGWASWTSQSATLAPGSAAGLGLVITPTVFSYRRFGAQVQAVEDDFIRASATAGLNAVDAFVRLLAVTPTPSFVETGISSTTLSIRVA